MAAVTIQIPNASRGFEGALVGVEKHPPLLKVKLSAESEGSLLRPNALVRVHLRLGDMPYMLTAEVLSCTLPYVVLKPTTSIQSCEQRARKRHPVNLQATIFYEESSAQARIVNISVTGVGLRTALYVPVEEVARLEFPLFGEETTILASILVRHVRSVAEDLYAVGASFVEMDRCDALWLRKLFP